MRRINKVIVSFLSIVGVLVASLGLSGVASARGLPLPADCYNLASGSYTATACTNPGQQRQTENSGKCFLINTSARGQVTVVNKEINCQTGQTVVSGTPGPSAQQKCENSNGAWTANPGGTGGADYICRCPSGTMLVAGECANREALCTGSNGAWTANPGGTGGADYICRCPSGKVLANDVCTTSTPTPTPTPTTPTPSTPTPTTPTPTQLSDDALTNNDLPVDSSVDNCKDSSKLDKNNCVIVRYLVDAINIMSAIAGMAIVGSIMIAGYQYMTARDNSGQIEAAKKRIIWALVALGIFISMYTFLNWVVPGGVL